MRHKFGPVARLSCRRGQGHLRRARGSPPVVSWLPFAGGARTAAMKKFLIPSLADIVFLSLLLGLLLLPGGGGLLNDGDTGYHIRAGEQIISTLSIPRTDMFSFHTPAIPWTAHEWLSEVIMAATHSRFGLTGVVFLFISLIAATYYLLFRVLRHYSRNTLLVIGLVVLALASSKLHWLARPHMFSLPLLIAWYHILDRFQYRHENVLFFLPLLLVPWVNLHGGYIVAFMLTGIYLAHNIHGALFGGEGRELHRAKARSLLLTLGGCLAASVINPYGFHILLFPFNLTGNQFIMDNVNEWLSPNFHEPLFFKYFLLLLIFILGTRICTLNFAEGSLVLLFTYMSLYSVRYIPLFSIIVAPILLKRLDVLMESVRNPVTAFLKRRSDVLRSVDSAARGFLWPLFSVAAALLLVASLGISFSFDPESKPVDAVEFLKDADLPGNMFNNDEFGDYLIYAAWPQYRVFFDGRSDMYGTSIMKEYFDIIRLGYDFDDIIEKYDINWVFYDNDSSLSYFLYKNDDWRLIYSDKVANIFIRDIPENGEVISRHRFTRLVRE